MARRIYIEDAENNFLYLNVAHDDTAAKIVAYINGGSNGTAKTERVLDDDELDDAGAYLTGPRDRPRRRPSSSSYRSAARKLRRRG